MMKKILFLLPLMALASCGGSASKATDSAEATMTPEEFAATQPLESGEYTATYFQYMEPDGKKAHFDGRLLITADPEQTVAYVYENGNRTKFTAQINLAKPFEKKDTIYTAVDAKEHPVILIVGSEVDTICFAKGENEVKVAFDKKPISVMSPEEAREAIINRRSK